MIILDIILPVMGGGKIYSRIKETNLRTRVFLWSGYSIESEAAEIIDRGCYSFIQRPFSSETLSSTIREILGRKEI